MLLYVFFLFLSIKILAINGGCKPLRGLKINENPYHPDLLSFKDSNILEGYGAPIILPIDPVTCLQNETNCSILFSKSISFNISSSFNVLLGNSKSVLVDVLNKTFDELTPIESVIKYFEKALIIQDYSPSNTISSQFLNSENKEFSTMKNLIDSFGSANKSEIENYFMNNNYSKYFTVRINEEFSREVEPNSCKLAVCLPHVQVIPIPCYNSTLDHYYVEFIMLGGNSTDICKYELINCSENVHLKEFPNTHEKESSNTFKFGEYGEPVLFDKISENRKFSLQLTEEGVLILKRRNKRVWDNRMGFFKGYKIRVRINEKGHLIEEVQGLFSKFAPQYRVNDWVTVWSSAPINHNVTIGLPNFESNEVSYKLVIEDNGELNLYDALGVTIWSATKPEAKHKDGYKFPEFYLVPTNFLTPIDSDAHNSLNNAIRIRNDSILNSLDRGCKFLESNEALMSPNKRFLMILEASGNMIIKDGYRTMWETNTANKPFAKAPYKLVLNPTGNIMILDSNLIIIWLSNEFDEILNSTRPYQLEILDEGMLVVRDKLKKIVWDSWPTHRSPVNLKIFTKIEYRFVQCYGKPPKVKKNLFSNSDNVLLQNEILISPNKNWELLILDKKALVLRSTDNNKIIYKSDVEIKMLILTKSSQLLLLCSKNITLWSSHYPDATSKNAVYQLDIANTGNVLVKDMELNETLWSFPKYVADSFNEEFESELIDSNIWNESNEFYIKNGYLVIRSGSSAKIDTNRKYDFVFGNILWKAKSIDGTSFILDSYNATSKQMFYLNNTQNKIIFGVTNGKHKIEAEFENESELFHVFNLIWEPNFIEFYIDGFQVLKTCDEEKIPKSNLFISIVASSGLTKNVPFLDYFKINGFIAKDRLETSMDVYQHRKLENHFKEFEVKSIGECWSICDKTSECEAISFTPNKCNLFDSNYTIKSESNWVTYAKTCEIGNMPVSKYNLKLLNNPILELNLNSTFDCQKNCEKFSGCVGISFKDGKCFLFDLKHELSKENGWLSRTPKILNLLDFKSYDNLIFKNNPLAVVHANNSKLCWQSCLEYFNCISASLNVNGTCYLFQSDFEYVKSFNWTSLTLKAIDLSSFEKLKEIEFDGQNNSDIIYF